MACGFSGGIWTLWNSEIVSVTHVAYVSQAITVKIHNVGGMAWLLTAVYASPCNTMRSTLWDHLVSISTMHNLPWIISGDSNEILSINEKKGGSLNGRIGGFKRWFNYSAMIDMRFQGSAFTWINNKVKKRLDRYIYNRDWRLLFADAKVLHLARMSSDHCPLLVKLFPHNHATRSNPPFCFHNMWMQHNSYNELISNTWNSLQGNVFSNSSCLASVLNSWNKDVFGNIFHQKKRLLARINGIQNALCVHDYPFLVKLETDPKQEYQIEY